MPPRPPAQHLEKLPALLGAAASSLRQGYWEPALHGLYYACFHAALALLSTAGMAPATHRGTREMLSLHFVKDGPLPRHLSRLFSQLMTDRELADYGVAGDITGDAAREAAGRATEFLSAVLTLTAERDPEAATAVGAARQALAGLPPSA